LTERIIERAGGAPRLFVRLEGQGTPLVLVHGVGADSSSWDEVVSALGPGFRTLRLDLRGHGRSGRIEGALTLDDFVRDVTDAMDAAGMQQADIAGFSLGGLIAQGLALAHPDRVDRLAIISAVAGRTADERAKVQARLEILRNEGIEAITSAAQDRWFTAAFLERHPEKVRLRMEQLKQNDPDSYKKAYTVFATSDLGDRLGAIRHKTLIATGEHDVGSNTRMARFMHDQIAGSELHILPGLKHSVLAEAPTQIASLLRDFFTR
jgi:(E)-2-((N-methylformamido)methylene)succinate hydrolase